MATAKKKTKTVAKNKITGTVTRRKYAKTGNFIAIGKTRKEIYYIRDGTWDENGYGVYGIKGRRKMWMEKGRLNYRSTIYQKYTTKKVFHPESEYFLVRVNY